MEASLVSWRNLLTASSLRWGLVLRVDVESVLNDGDIVGVRALESSPGYSLEGLFYICVFFRTCFEVRYFVELAPFLSLRFRDLSCVHIALVSEDHEREVGSRLVVARIIQELLLPVVQVCERFRVGHVENENAAIRPAVERDTQGLKPLLASSVPDLKCRHLRVHRNVLNQEISPDGRLVLAAKLLVNVSVHQRCLPDPAISENDNFQQRFLTVGHLCGTER
mmetsp:Transcript_12635/g.22931  ORF Transcript_12635/g.22931 Transcript_12635/m.22931 type:complete len:223 (-) Transcript_12635:62-730(-)